MKIVICVIALISVVHGAFLSMDQCGLDVSNDCHSYHTAKKCNSLGYCKAFVWNRPSVPSEVCTLCKDEITKLQNFVEKKTTEEMVQKDLLAFCKVLKIQEVIDECEQLVINDFDAVYDDVIALLNPDVVCTALCLCNKVDAEKEVKKLMGDLPDLVKKALSEKKLPMAAPIEPVADSCSDCEAFMTDFHNIVLNNKKLLNDWINMMKTECATLAEGADILCKKNADSLVYQIVTRSRQNVDDRKSICRSLMMCGRSSSKRVGDFCTDCKNFFTDWQRMLKDNQTLINHIVEVTSEFYCLQKPLEEREQCARYVGMVIKVLLNQMEREDVGKICAKLEFCPPLPAVIKTDVTKVAKKMAKAVMQTLPKQKLQAGSDYCMDCKNAITDLQGVIANNQSIVQELTDLVKQQCSQLGPELEPECESLIDDKREALLHEIEAADADTICSVIMMCTGKAKLVKTGDLCMDCTAFFTDWQAIIANNKSIIEQLRESLREQYCQPLPEMLRTKCDSYLDKFFEELMNYLENTDPSEVCATLYFCAANEMKRPEHRIENVQEVLRRVTPKTKNVESEVECQGCRFLVEEVEKYIEENKTEEAIESALQEVCKLYGQDIREECMQFMEQHGDALIDFLLQEMNSLDICVKLGLCEKAERFWLHKPLKVAKEKNDLTCELCKAVTAELESLLTAQSTEKDMIEALEKVCSLLPTSDQEPCNRLMEIYGLKLFELLINEVKPGTLCKLIELCMAVDQEETRKISSDTACDVCKAVAEVLDSVLSENSTKEEIEAALKEVCDELPSKDIQTECEALVRDYGDDIVNFLVEEMKPSKICTDLQLCTALSVTKNKAKDDCQICQLIADKLDTVLKQSSTQQEIVEALKQVCSLLPSELKDQCDTLIIQYKDEIINALIEEMNPSVICTQLGLCVAVKKTKKVADDIPCELCELVMEELDQLLTTNATETEIEEALDKVCDLLPDTYRDDCTSLVNEYGDTIIRLIADELSPANVCSAIGLCTEKPPSVKKVSDDVSCELCKLVMEELDEMLTNNATEAEIRKALDEVCDLLPETYQDKCTSLVAQYEDTIVQLIAEELSPAEVCSAIELCQKLQLAEKVQTVKLRDEISQYHKISSELSCDACKVVAGELQKLLNQNATDEEIKQALEDVCGLVESFKSACDDLVEQYWDEILEILKKSADPSALCTELKLCTNAAKFIKMKSNARCQVCEVVMEELKKLLSEQSTEEEIETAVEKVCTILPAEYQGPCKEYIEDYGPGVISILVQDFVPDKICALYGICREKGRGVTNQLHLRDDEKCDLCKEVISYMSEFLEQNATQTEVEKALEKVCNFLPTALLKECDDMVDQYAPLIFEYLPNIMDPNFVCEKIKICPYKMIRNGKMLGGDPCTFGPSYWCKNANTAKECNAVSHCMNHIWN